MRTTDGVRGVRAGGARVGIGILGLAPTHLFLGTGFSTAPSVGDSIRRGGCIRPRSTATDMGMAVNLTITISAVTFIPGALATTTWEAAITPMAFIADPDLQAALSAPALECRVARVASEPRLTAVAFTEVVSMEASDFTAGAAFMADNATPIRVECSFRLTAEPKETIG